MITHSNMTGMRQWAVRCAMVALTLATHVAARAQIQDEAFQGASTATTSVTPYAEMQYSTITGSGNTITISRLPVITSTGAIVYKNETVLFNVDANGILSVASGYPKAVISPTPIISSFKAGTYAAPSNLLNGTGAINVSGPGATLTGATEWSLAAAPGAYGCTYPSTATWYVGSLANSPLATRLKAAGITSNAWSYGVTGEPACGGQPYWARGTLIGLSQTGNTLTIVSFSYNDNDSNEPQDQITYTLKQ